MQNAFPSLVQISLKWFLYINNTDQNNISTFNWPAKSFKSLVEL